MASAKRKIVSNKVKSTAKTTKSRRVAKKAVSKSLLVGVEQLKKFYYGNMVMAILYSIFAVFVVLVAKARYVTLGTHYVTQDVLLSKAGQVVSVQGFEPLVTFDLRWLVAALLVIAAGVCVAASTKRRASFERCLQDGCNKSRWLTLGTSGAGMMLVVAALVGVYDIGILASIFLSTTVLSGLMYANERSFVADSKVSKLLLLISIVIGIAPWIVLEQYKAGAILYGEGLSLWIMIAAHGAVIASWLLIWVNQLARYYGKAWGRSFVAVEWVYGAAIFIQLAAVAKLIIFTS